MSKAVLVINMPNRCSECPICASWQASASSIREYWCPPMDGHNVEPDEKPIWCPLEEQQTGFEEVVFENGAFYEKPV